MIIIGTSGRSASLYLGADLAMHQHHPSIRASCTVMRDSTDSFCVCVCIYVNIGKYRQTWGLSGIFSLMQFFFKAVDAWKVGC